MRTIEGMLLGYLLNSLWQAPLLYLATLAAIRLVRPVGVQAEHWAAMTGLLAAAVVPACRMPGSGFTGRWFGEAAVASGGKVGVALATGMLTGDRGLRVSAEVGPWIAGVYVAMLLWACGRLLWRLRLGWALRREASALELTAEAARSWD